MRTREKSMNDYGMSDYEVIKIRQYCRHLSVDDRNELFQCAINATPGLEIPVYDSIINHIGYGKLLEKGCEILANKDDFYAYRRKTLYEFYKKMVEKGKL